MFSYCSQSTIINTWICLIGRFLSHTYLYPIGNLHILSDNCFIQAAAFAYAYYKMEAYSEIDGFLLNRQTDAGEEVAQGLAFGLNDAGGGRKQLYDVFKYIDTPNHAAYTDFAKEIIGISSWSEIIR